MIIIIIILITHPIFSLPQTTEGSLPHLPLAQLREKPRVAVSLGRLIIIILSIMIGLLVIIILKMMELAVGEMQVRIHEDDKKRLQHDDI